MGLKNENLPDTDRQILTDATFSDWPEYCREFPRFSEQTMRPGCQPCRLLHEKPSARAIVLVHGLTDSPYYLKAIGQYFYGVLGYDVFLPLLQGHGLREPPTPMAGVSLGRWKENVRFAVRAAAAGSRRVSVGGLSTGGALSFHTGCTDPLVTGDIYLFSAALGLYGGRLNLYGGLVESLLLTPLSSLDSGKTLQGTHPYRYDRVPLNSARELVELIREIKVLRWTAADKIGARRIFAAWSEYDRVINWRRLASLQFIVKKGNFVPFIIPAAARVDHACVVLQEPVYAIGSRPGDEPLERPNPYFSAMMTALHRFEETGRKN